MSNRKWAAILLTLLLAPGTFIRSEAPPDDFAAPILIEQIEFGPVTFGHFYSERGWGLESASRVFGGYSALARLGDGRLVAGSDAGSFLVIEHDGAQPVDGTLLQAPGLDRTTKREVDLEALSSDPSGLRLWAAFERTNSIQALAPDLSIIERFEPEAMAGWTENSGAESLVALSDGRLVAISEGSRDNRHPVVMFGSAPGAGGAVSLRDLVPVDGFRPVDAVQVGSDEILVLFRDAELLLPPRFNSAIASYSLSDLQTGEAWRPRRVSHFPAAIPRENYEGMAVMGNAEGGIRLWIISDDNFSALQDTRVLEILYSPPGNGAHEKVRGWPARR